MIDLDWRDLQHFLVVARAGGLTPAAKLTGLSAATLGRRITALETALAERLFVRGRTGYALTDSGQALLSHAANVEDAVLGIDRWQSGKTTRRVVRVSAGAWMARFLARNIATVWTPDDAWSVELTADTARVDIARRRADIGIRNTRPDEPWLAGRRVGTVAFAIYGRADAFAADADVRGTPWVGVTGVAAATPSAQWTADRHGGQIVVRVSAPHLTLDLVRQGSGLAVLPCLAGDPEPALRRIGDPIDALTHDQWLVLHHEERHHPAVRAAADRVARLIRANESLLKGEPAHAPATAMDSPGYAR